MTNLKELRGRINSVKNTRKITSAMSRIAAARLAKAQAAVIAARPYGTRLREVVDHLIAGVDASDASEAHPLLEKRGVERVGIIIMNADRGLCGGFNSNVQRTAQALIDRHQDAGRQVVVVTVGKKARSFFRHAGQAITTSHHGATLENLVELSKAVAVEATSMFLPHEPDTELPQVDEIYLISNHFVSVLTQTVETIQLLPVPRPEPGAVTGPEPSFEPGRKELLNHLLPVALEARLQQAMFDSIAAEVAARRMAMNSATDNATELIGDLTLQFNRERQAAITRELMEIIGGAEALKG